MIRHWILDENRKVKPASLLTWAKWFERVEERRVAETIIAGIRISTVFMGLDLDHGMTDVPALWETMVFGDGWAGMDSDRCSGSWEQAAEMHTRMCDRVRDSLGLGLDKPVTGR